MIKANAKRFLSLMCVFAMLLSSVDGLAESGGSAMFGIAVQSGKNEEFSQTVDGAYMSVTVEGSCKKNQQPQVRASSASGSDNLTVLEAYTVDGIKNGTELSADARLSAVPELASGEELAFYSMTDDRLTGVIAEDISVGDAASQPLAFKGVNGVALVKVGLKAEDQPVEGKVLWANDDLYLTGKMPGNAVVEATPVTVEIDGLKVISAYDIKIYTNKNQQAKGKTWKPVGDKVQVHFKSEAFSGEDVKALSAYHLETVNDEPQLVAENLIPDSEGWVSFDADSFSVYAVAGLIEKDIEIEGATYRVSLTYDSDAGIPDNAQLDVTPVEMTDEEAAAMMGYGEDDIVLYTKVLDISILADGVEIEPNEGSQVTVTVQLLDAVEGADIDVFHMAPAQVNPAVKSPLKASPAKAPAKAPASASLSPVPVESSQSADGSVTFTTDSFSYFGFSSVAKEVAKWSDTLRMA